VLDGNYLTTEIVQVVASNVTVADLTLREAYDHPIHVMPSEAAATNGTLVYNVHVVDPGQQAIKVNPLVPGGPYADGGTVACSPGWSERNSVRRSGHPPPVGPGSPGLADPGLPGQGRGLRPIFARNHRAVKPEAPVAQAPATRAPRAARASPVRTPGGS
jgi:hypothetical protein